MKTSFRTLRQIKTLLTLETMCWLGLVVGFVSTSLAVEALAGDVGPRTSEVAANAELPADADPDPMSLDGAWKDTSETRVRYSLNGLWQCRPSLKSEVSGFLPQVIDSWGWAKLPSVWIQGVDRPFTATRILARRFSEVKDSQISPDRAWYGRTIRMPEIAKDRRVEIVFTMVNTKVVVYVDGENAGACTNPGGKIDISRLVKPGREQRILLDVTAFPFVAEKQDFSAPDRGVKVRSRIWIKGVTGDVYLDVGPKGERITSAYVETRVGEREITFVSEGVTSAKSVARVFDGAGRPVRRFEGKGPRFSARWPDAELWDTHTPGNRYRATISAYDDKGRLIDESLPFWFGFREVSLDGRDIKLNGKTVHLRALYCPTPQRVAGFCCREACRETCRRLKDEGYNFIIGGNYSFAPASVTYYEAILDACDEFGVLFSYSLPHVKEFGFDKFAEPDVRTRYRDQCKWAMDGVRNHPSIVSWAINHNSTGYCGDLNPARMDGSYRPEDALGGASRSQRVRVREQAHESWKIVKALDPSRPCYHHESGNLDDFYTVNIYLNWAPRQERSDWLQHWHEKGVKPLFFVEWGMPHISTWSSWRGPEFIWKDRVFQSLMAREGAAQVLGEAAYEDTPEMRKAIESEESLWAKGQPFKWAVLNRSLLSLSNLYYGVQAHYMADNWRSHRAWGLSAALPWDQDAFHERVKKASRRPNPDRYRNLKRPGIVPDEFGVSSEYFCDTSAQSEWKRTAIGEVMCRWNMPDCAFIGGDGVFTDKTHIYAAGSEIRKTLVLLNDNRESRDYDWVCRLVDKNGVSQGVVSGRSRVPAGGRVDRPVSFSSPKSPGDYVIRAEIRAKESVQADAFAVSVIAAPSPGNRTQKLFVYDPHGMTVDNLRRLGFGVERLKKLADLPGWSKGVVIGREALTDDIYLNEVLPIARGGKRVLIFEQSRAVLSSIGFRVQEYGLRNAYLRYGDRRMEGFSDVLLSDWSGESTLLPRYCDEPQDSDWEYIRRPWAGFMNTRVFRCGTRNAVATVIPEKPTVGDWRALADGGFDLQYAPLLEQRVGKGDARIVFCQFDVTGRTVTDPAADALVCALVGRQPEQPKETGAAFAIGVQAHSFVEDGLACHCWAQSADQARHFLVSDANAMPAGFSEAIMAGGVAVCVGLDADGVRKVCPSAPPCENRRGNHFERIIRLPPELNGLHNGSWAWHGALDFAAFTDRVADGNNAIRVVPYGKGKCVFLQVAPWAIDAERKPYLRATKRHVQEMLERVMGNCGMLSGGGLIRYRDLPVASDDPYRYYRW